MELDLPCISRSGHKSDMTTALSRREREILNIIYRLGEGTVEQIRTELRDQPHYSTVRALLRVLEEKGHLTHGERNLRYVYKPVIPKAEAAQSAVDRVLTTFFDGSVESLLHVLLSRMSTEEIERARHLLDCSENNAPTSRCSSSCEGRTVLIDV